MRLSRLAVLPVLLSGALALPLQPAAGDPAVVPAPPQQAPVAADDDPVEVAIEALEETTKSLDGSGALEPSTALMQLNQVLDDLPATERKQAEAMFARPTDGPSSEDYFTYPEGVTVQRECGAHTCVHYVRSTQHATTPAWVQTTLAVMEHVWAKEIGGLGYDAPPSDGTKGGNAKVDVYLGNVGNQGIYGYANVDRPNRDRSPGYLVLDNDFAEFPGVPRKLLRATAAHEFFHVVQFGYQTTEDTWFLESTATWIEEQVYDGVNDNRQFLATSSARYPGRELDLMSAMYGNWIFFQNLSERHGPEIIRNMWVRAARDGVRSTSAIHRALRARGSSLNDAFIRFSADNTMPARAYEEGAAYPTAKKSRTWRLTRSNPSTGKRRARIDHLSARDYVLRPARNFGSRWKLHLWINGPSRAPRAYVVVFRGTGRISRIPVDLNRHGNARVTVPFSHDGVRKIGLTVANTSSRYKCNTGGGFSCDGTPKDDKARFLVRGTARN